MKRGLITGLLMAVAQLGIAQVTDTLGYSDFLTGTQVLYDSPNGGYAFGNNGYGDKAKAQSYYHDQSFVLRKVLLLFGEVKFESTDSNSVVRVNVYNNYGTGVTSLGQSDSIAPDSVLGFVDIPVYQLINGGSFTEASFAHDTIVIRDRFSVGIDLTMMSQGDTVGLMSTTDGDAMGTFNSWELTSNDDWFTVEHPVYSWGLDVSLAIFPVIDADDPAGIHQFEKRSLSVYPNPCVDQLMISNTELKFGQVNIYDAQGREVMNMSNTNEIRSINVSDLQSGIYSITITNDQTQWSSKFVKTY
ncbi:MAG: T9SS type A sorting domain-containing protein [Flavobacteriales bacterium]|nr:T9SS type A sorting domain-containing protein [Flavobacteriales bacterium]